MGLLRRSRVSAGLDIGSGFVKLVLIDHSKPEPEITGISTGPLVPDTIVDGEIMDPVLVAESVRSVTRTARLKRERVVTAVGGHDVIIKKIQMDRASEADARALIRWEAEQHVPFDMEGVQLDFQIMDPEGTDPQMSVLLVAAKRDIIDQKLGVLADAGVSPSIIDVDAFALHNAFEQNYPDALSGLAALINVGHETTNVNLFDDGVPVLVRDLPFGTRRVRESLQRERGLSLDEAADVLDGKSTAVDLHSFVAGRAEELAVGIERAAAFVTAHSDGRQLGRVFLSGGAANMPGLADSLGQRLGVRTEVANPLQRIAVRPEVAQAVDIDVLAPMLMLAVGLALRQAN